MSGRIHILGYLIPLDQWTRKPRWPWFCGLRVAGLWWFRVRGWGLHWKCATRYPLVYSERLGYSPGLCVGRWRLRLLRPEG